MDKKSILGEIKKLINFKDEKEEIKMSFKDAKVGDLIVRVEGDDFAVGLPLLVVTEDGAIPASPELEGEHKLDDGRVITLDAKGVITEVKEAVVEDLGYDDKKDDFKVEDKEEKMKEEDKEEKMKEEEEVEMTKEEMKMKFGNLEKRVEEMENIMKDMMEVNKETAKFSSAVTKQLEGFIKDTPAELEFKSIKTDYNSNLNEKTNKLKTNLESIRNLRKK